MQAAAKLLRAKEGAFLVRTKSGEQDHQHVISTVSDGRLQHWRLFLPRVGHPSACKLEVRQAKSSVFLFNYRRRMGPLLGFGNQERMTSRVY